MPWAHCIDGMSACVLIVLPPLLLNLNSGNGNGLAEIYPILFSIYFLYTVLGIYDRFYIRYKVILDTYCTHDKCPQTEQKAASCPGSGQFFLSNFHTIFVGPVWVGCTTKMEL